MLASFSVTIIQRSADLQKNSQWELLLSIFLSQDKFSAGKTQEHLNKHSKPLQT